MPGFVGRFPRASGNQAFGSGEFVRKKLLVIIAETQEIDLCITCSVNGVVS